MKKSLIALAVASAVSAPAFAATSNVDVYGRMHFAIEDTNYTGVDMDIKTNASRFGLKGSEDLGGGLKAIWQIEQQFDATSADNTAMGGQGLRNTFIGLSGGFGTVVLGRHDTPYKLSTTKYNVFADTIADYAATRLDNTALITGHARASNAIAYISPNFSGLSFSGAVVTSTDQLDSGDSMDAISLAAGYANGPLTVDLAWEKIGSAVGSLTDLDDRKAWKLGAGYSFGAAKIGAVYEDVNDDADRDSLFLVGSYTMGAIVLKGQYGQVDAATDMKAWALGADYNLSKRTTAFIVYGSGDDDRVVAAAGTVTHNADGVKGWNIGMTHNF
jgi:predicted porin